MTNTYELLDYKRQHVKHRLMDLRYYEICVREHEVKLLELRDQLDTGGIKSPQFNKNGETTMNLSNKGNWIIELLDREEKIIKELQKVKQEIETINNLLEILDEEEQMVIKHYVITRQCKDLEHATFELNVANARQLMRIVARAFTKMAENV